MNPPDFRSLCAEFVGAVDALLSQGESPANPGVKLLLTVHVEDLAALAEDARAALAQPVGKSKSLPPDYVDPEHTEADRRLLEVFYSACQAEGGTSDEITLRGLKAALAQPVAEGPTDEELREFVETLRNQWIGAVVIGGKDPDSDDFDMAISRAVLANWGRPTPQPIPVSERLPGEGDCDAEGRCWWFCPTSFLPNGMCAYWCLAPVDDPRSWRTHWLPHWALPLPAAPAAEEAQP